MGFPGVWNDMNNIQFTWRWYRVATNSTTCTTGTSLATTRDYVPSSGDIGSWICVTVFASDSTGVNTTSNVITLYTQAPVIGLNPAQTTPSSVAQFKTVANGGLPPFTTMVWLTAYGWPDNSPPSAAIAYPASATSPNTYPNQTSLQGIHRVANGTGTYEDPVTIAVGISPVSSSNALLPRGTEIYVPSYQKYFIIEDSCGRCGRDMFGRDRENIVDPLSTGGSLGVGTSSNGGPGMFHLDPWIDGHFGDWPDAIACEEALTDRDANGIPIMQEVIINPTPDMPVNLAPIFDNATSSCNGHFAADGVTVTGGVDIERTATVSPYVLLDPPAGVTVPAQGLCLTNPGNSRTIHTKLTIEACDGSASQMFSKVGEFLLINNLCVSYGDVQGNPSSAQDSYWLERCNMNNLQHIQQYPDGTVTNMATHDGKTVVRDDSNHWAFAQRPVNNAQLPLSLSVTSLKQGAELEISGYGLNTPEVDLYLVNADESVKIFLETLAADYLGVFSTKVTIPADLPSGQYRIFAQGNRDIVPDTDPGADGLSTAITLTSQLPVGMGSVTLDNFKFQNRVIAMIGYSSVLTVGATGPGADTGGQTLTTSSWQPYVGTALAGLLLVGGFALYRRRQAA
jgi:hypothetical protein